MKTTVLHEEHVALDARMAPFGGFDMPIQYAGILEEHHAARNRCAVFDTCHMGEFRICGSAAVEDLERLLSCNVDSLGIGRCRYGLMCRPDGGVVDDQILYRLGPAEFMMVVNAGTREGDAEWIRMHISPGTEFTDESANTAKIDLQGPQSIKAANVLFDTALPPLEYYQFCSMPYGGRKLIVSRTGYTGEIGLEIYCPAELAVPIWRRTLELAAVPAGLGARDTLRLEMGYPLYGHELSPERNAGTTGYSWAISSSKPFIGCEAVRSADAQREKLVGLLLEGRRAARRGDRVTDASGRLAGTVTSGSFSPSLRKGIALAYVSGESARTGTPLQVETRREALPAHVVKTPFYKNGTVRESIDAFV